MWALCDWARWPHLPDILVLHWGSHQTLGSSWRRQRRHIGGKYSWVCPTEGEDQTGRKFLPLICMVDRRLLNNFSGLSFVLGAGTTALSKTESCPLELTV